MSEPTKSFPTDLNNYLKLPFCQLGSYSSVIFNVEIKLSSRYAVFTRKALKTNENVLNVSPLQESPSKKCMSSTQVCN